MATAARAPREVIEFAPNLPVTFALKYAQGKKVGDGDRMMLSTTDGRVVFLDLDVAAQVEALGVNVRENITICKRWTGKRGDPITWEVSRPVGEQPNGTFVVPAPSPAVSSSGAAERDRVTPKPPAAAASSTGSTALVAEANALVDAYAEVLARALDVYQGKVKPDEVRALLISSYIQRRQLSSVA